MLFLFHFVSFCAPYFFVPSFIFLLFFLLPALFSPSFFIHLFSDLPCFFCFLFKSANLSFLFSYYFIFSACDFYSIFIQSVLNCYLSSSPLLFNFLLALSLSFFTVYSLFYILTFFYYYYFLSSLFSM